MGGIFFFTTTIFRALFLLLAGASITLLTFTRAAETNQPPLNPFANYVDIIMRRYESDIVTCRLYHVSFSYLSRCSPGHPDEALSEIKEEFSPENPKMPHATFTLPEKLTLGQVVLLWGKPEVDIIGEVAYFTWPRSHIMATAQTHHGRISYWLPIINVTFHSTE